MTASRWTSDRSDGELQARLTSRKNGRVTNPSIREPLDPDAFSPDLPRWQVQVVAETASTNADLLAAASTGTPAGAVLVAEFQHGGRGRLDRSWLSPPGAGLTFSLLLRPVAPPSNWGWLPLLAGLALVETVGAEAQLKWPNDLLLGSDGLKAAGILTQTADRAVVIGIGLNVSTTRDELPVATGTSLALQGQSRLDRTALLRNFLARLGELYDAWQAAGGDAQASGLAAAYRACCATLGGEVSVELGGRTLLGLAEDIDAAGRLLVREHEGGGVMAVAAGDVTHLRNISR
jgi:BirA family biotin operon repressor/biotin-[acetyl-CoA-carboxylase] ligase